MVYGLCRGIRDFIGDALKVVWVSWLKVSGVTDSLETPEKVRGVGFRGYGASLVRHKTQLSMLFVRCAGGPRPQT